MKRNILILLLGIILVSCAPKPNQPSIFDNPICQSPCWQNITPGVTTKNDALIILSELSFVQQPMVDPKYSAVGYDDIINFSLYQGEPNFIAGWMYILDDKVSMMGFENNLGTMQHLIELFGAPQSILVLRTDLFDQVTFVNPQSGILFYRKYVGSYSVETSELTPETAITGVAFFDPHEYERVLNSGILSAYKLSADETINNLRPWNGYGSIKEKYWPPATQPPQ